MSENFKKSNKTYINNMGSVLVSKKDGSKYIKIDKDVTLPKGTVITIKTMVDSVKEKLERGIIGEEEAEKQIESFSKGGNREFVLYTITAVISEQ
jgi:hypothetical protein